MKSNSPEENALTDKIWSSPIMHVEEERALFNEMDSLRADLIGDDRTFWFSNEGIAMLKSILNSPVSARDKRVERFVQIRDRVFLGSARYVRHYVQKHFGRSVSSLDERLQEGMIGVLESILRFDSSHSVRFMTFAQWYVRASVQRLREEMGQFLHIPGRIFSIHRFLRTYKGDSTSAEEIQKALEAKYSFSIPLRSVQDAMVHLSAYSTAPGYQGDDSEPNSIYEMMGDFVDPSQNLENERLAELMKQLSEREQRILRLHFGFDGDDVNMVDIGREYSLSRERIRQIQAVALRRLRLLIEKDEFLPKAVTSQKNLLQEPCYDAIQRRRPNRTDRGRIPGGRIPGVLGVRRPEPAEVG